MRNLLCLMIKWWTRILIEVGWITWRKLSSCKICAIKLWHLRLILSMLFKGIMLHNKCISSHNHISMSLKLYQDLIPKWSTVKAASTLLPNFSNTLLSTSSNSIKSKILNYSSSSNLWYRSSILCNTNSLNRNTIKCMCLSNRTWGIFLHSQCYSNKIHKYLIWIYLRIFRCSNSNIVSLILMVLWETSIMRAKVVINNSIKMPQWS